MTIDAHTHPDAVALLLGKARIDPRQVRLPISGIRAALGFPSPTEDFQDDGIDLNELLISNAPATFFYRAEGDSMMLAGICDGDILIVDRSVEVRTGQLVLATWEGNQPTCKLLKVVGSRMELHSRNPDYAKIVLPAETEVEMFAVTGVVRMLHPHRKRPR